MLPCHEVLKMLLPKSEYVMRGEDYESIIFISGETVTKEEFENALIKYPAWKAEQDAGTAAKKTSLLERLGITEDEAKLLLS